MDLATMVHSFLIDGHGSPCVLKVPCIKRYIPCYHTRKNGEKLMRRQTQEGNRMLDTACKYSEDNAVCAYCMTHLAMTIAKKYCAHLIMSAFQSSCSQLHRRKGHEDRATG